MGVFSLKIRDLWALMPVGMGGLIGIFGKRKIEPLVAGFGLDMFSRKVASSIIVVIGLYLMQGKGLQKNIGTGMGVIGTALFMVSAYEMFTEQ